MLKLTEELTTRGHEAYSFLQNGANLSTGASIGEELRNFGEALQDWGNNPTIRRIFDSELENLKNSDIVVLLLPAGGSSHVEAGIAYGLGKRVMIIGRVERPEVFYLICEKIYPDADAFLREISP